jgi:citrate lyase subunit beta / citryl-CoA lyase
MNPRIVWHMMPGDSERMIRKSLEIRPDVIIPCLEDGVVYDPIAKQQARELLVRLSTEIDWQANGILYYPRINRSNSEYWRDDVLELMNGKFDGFVIAKEESPDRVRDVAEFITEQEQRLGRPVGELKLIVMIETALGLHRTYELASATDRVEGLLLGREDLSASLGIMRRLREIFESKHEELLYARSKFVAECKAAGREAIDGAPFTFQDEAYMLHDCGLAARLGFTGKLSAHPKHAEFIRKGFLPDPEDVAIARQIVDGAQEYVDRGEAPVFGVAGMEVTPPVVEQARLVVARAERAQSTVTS